MSRNVKTVIAVIVVVILIIAISVNQKPKVTGPISIGVIAPMSGPGAALGEFAKNVSDITVEKINKEGGVNGQPINLIYEDDSCDPAKSVSAAQKLMNVDHVNIILGTTCSAGVMSFVPVVTQNGVFVFSSFATSDKLRGVSPLFARTIPSETGLSEALANYSISKGWKKIAIIQENSEYPESMVSTFETAVVPM